MPDGLPDTWSEKTVPSETAVALCPVCVGTVIVDTGLVPVGSFGPVLVPEMLEPFLREVGSYELTGSSRSPATVRIKELGLGSPEVGKSHDRVEISEHDLEALERRAQRTYAPATTESRNAGAGSDGSDND